MRAMRCRRRHCRSSALTAGWKKDHHCRRIGVFRCHASSIRQAIVALALVVSSNTVALGQGRTDVVTLPNGDRITGEVVSLERGRLEFKTDDAGTLEIEWDNVATLEAMRQFDVLTSDGSRFLGSLGRAAEPFVLMVGDVSLPMFQATLIFPIGANFWKKLDGSLDVGFNYTRSSGVAQATLGSETVFRRPAFAVNLDFSATLTKQQDETEPDDRGNLDLSYVRYRGRRWLVSGATRLETNESLGLVLRSQVGAVVGLRLVNTNRAQFEVGGGLMVNDERGVDTDPTQNLEGLLTLRSSFYTYDRPKTTFSGSVQYYPNLTTWGRQRLQVDSNIKREVWKDFYFSFDVFDTFDSAPPNPDAARNDVGVVTSISWSY